MTPHHHTPFIFIFSFICGFSLSVTAQTITSISSDSAYIEKQKEISYYKQQRDLIDYFLLILGKDPSLRTDTAGLKSQKLHISASTITEYTLSTGFAIGAVASGAFYTSDPLLTKTSSIQAVIKYTQKKQFLVPIQSSIWAPNNTYNFIGDWRYLYYPQDSYGFGGYTTSADKFIVTYKYVRFYEFGLRKIRKNFYMGLGYQLDFHWDITQSEVPNGQITDFEKYGYSTRSLSSGIAYDILYDSRKNSLNPEGGSTYGNVEFLQNSKLLGSSSSWNSVLIDLRKYIKMPHNNVLAFWSYNVFTLNGNPPYLDLPGTETDSYNNTGRGYEQDRFIGKKMVDLEAEYRFGITRNGFIGGVVFANAESLSELRSNQFAVISPAAGLGLRMKFNKFSNTNVCLDYGVGTKGSRGFFGNLGEVF